MGKITISVEEYKKLLECKLRSEFFADFVNNEKYCIDRKTCASYIGFDLKEKKDAGTD